MNGDRTQRRLATLRSPRFARGPSTLLTSHYKAREKLGFPMLATAKNAA
jgi:hypothetical protein